VAPELVSALTPEQANAGCWCRLTLCRVVISPSVAGSTTELVLCLLQQAKSRIHTRNKLLTMVRHEKRGQLHFETGKRH